MRSLLIYLFIFVSPTYLSSQNLIKGRILDGKLKEGIPGATILIEGTDQGSISDLDGYFTIKNAPSGKHQLVITGVGFVKKTMEIQVSGALTDLQSLEMESDAIGLEEISVVASYAIDRKTPVAVSTLNAEMIEAKLNNQEFTEILKITPSIYSSKLGGGFGDSRINVRGFDQTNTAVLINGIPVNDMENGRVFWSNWSGLGDVTREIQVQRGLGASKLAINSVGGTINILTRTTDQRAGGTAGINIANDGYFKYNMTVSTGRMDGGWALTLAGSRTTGNGYINGTWIDSWSYFAAFSKELGINHQIGLTVTGSPQRHGQRTTPIRLGEMIPLTDPDGDYLKQLENGKVGNHNSKSEIRSTRFNPDFGTYQGHIYSMRENYYHKPQYALNHYWNISKKAFLATSLYSSIGRGGGTGERGNLPDVDQDGKFEDTYEALFRNKDGTINFDALFNYQAGRAANSGKYGRVAGESSSTSPLKSGMIQRASMNEHNWFGALSTFKLDLTNQIHVLAGLDWRKYRGIHYRRVQNLLGNDAWLDPRNINAKSIQVDINRNGVIDPTKLDLDNNGVLESNGREFGNIVYADAGDFTIENKKNKINYDNDGIINWLGGFGQVEYSNGPLSTFIAGSISNTGYQREDRFSYADTASQLSKKVSFSGFNIKAGVNYNLSKAFNVFVNGGNYSKAPSFEAVFPFLNNIPNISNSENANGARNEKVIAGEAGVGYRSSIISANLNYYYTIWKDHFISQFYQTLPGSSLAFVDVNILGVGVLHKGIELEILSKPFKTLELRGMASIGDWTYNTNGFAVILDDNQHILDTTIVYTNGLKVGDAPQTTFGLSAFWRFAKGFALDVDYFHFMNFYANFNASNRLEPNPAQALSLPDFGTMDVALQYSFKVSGTDCRVRMSVYNIWDELYVADASDASKLTTATGFFGFGRTWNLGFRVRI